MRKNQSWREDSSIRKSMSKSTNVAFDGLNSKPQERRMKKGGQKPQWRKLGREEGDEMYLLIYSVSQIDFPFGWRGRGGRLFPLSRLDTSMINVLCRKDRQFSTTIIHSLPLLKVYLSSPHSIYSLD